MMRAATSRRAARRGGERGGCLLRLVVLLLVVGAALSLAWMALLPIAFTRAVHERTGFDAEVASFSANPFTGRMLVRGLVVANPATFPARDFVQVRSFEADFGWWSLLSERLVIESLTVDVRQVTLLKRANGPTNLEVFRSGLAGPGPKTAATPPPLVIKRLQVRFDTLVLADHTGPKPRLRTYKLGLDQQFSNISHLSQLFVPAVLRSFGEEQDALSIVAFLPPDLVAKFGETAKAGETWWKAAERKTGEVFRGLLDKLEETRKP